jgi:hypothetical protein
VKPSATLLAIASAAAALLGVSLGNELLFVIGWLLAVVTVVFLKPKPKVEPRGPATPTGGFSDPNLKARFQELNSYFSFKESEARLDAYSKWLFGLVAVLITLGSAGFVSNTLRPTGAGLLTWGAAIVFAGVAFAWGSKGLVPRWAAHDGSLPGMDRAAKQYLMDRVRNYRIAGELAGAALILAALTPLATYLVPETGSFFFLRPNGPQLAYEVKEPGVIEASVEGDGLDRFSTLTMWSSAGVAADPPCATPPGSPQLPVATPTPELTPAITKSNAADPTPAPSVQASFVPAASPSASPGQQAASPSASAEATGESAIPDEEGSGPPLFLPAHHVTADFFGRAEATVTITDLWQLTDEPVLCVTWFGGRVGPQGAGTLIQQGELATGGRWAAFDLPVVVRPVPSPGPSSD